jgi:hypothetical protein
MSGLLDSASMVDVLAGEGDLSDSVFGASANRLLEEADPEEVKPHAGTGGSSKIRSRPNFNNQANANNKNNNRDRHNNNAYNSNHNNNYTQPTNNTTSARTIITHTHK